MRILQVCSARDIGGGEKHLADLSNSLVERGHQVFLAAAPGAPITQELFNIPPENIIFSRMRNALDISSASELANFARRTRTEIIHAHLGRDYLLAAIAARLSKTPFVLTRHVLFPLKRQQKFSLRQVGGVIAPSTAVAKSLKNQNIFPLEKITLIRHGINLKHFSDERTAQNEIFTVGTIGHLAPIKGHDVFIRAAEIVLRKRQEVRFVIVGEDKSPHGENRREIENLIAELNLQAKVELAGWHDDVRPFFKKFDLFVSAARTEPFGLVMVEAMAHQLPVIASRSEGASEIIEDSKSGVLVPVGDADSLARAILDLMENRAQRESLGINGRRRAEENFSLETMVEKTEEFYRRVLRKRFD